MGSTKSWKELHDQFLMALSCQIESYPAEKLNLHLVSRFDDGIKSLSRDAADPGEFLELNEAFTRGKVFERVKRGELDCNLVILGMIVTSGEWHERYVSVFLGDNSIYEEKMLVALMREMATDEIDTSIDNMTYDICYSRCGWEKDYNDKIALERRRRESRTVKDRWAEVLKKTLWMKIIKDGIEKGKYAEELENLMKKDVLREVLFRCGVYVRDGKFVWKR